ncbi:MAG: prepilin peptidase [Rhodobacteraceae bacterium]|nr:prepilin peptidase [Paracoccaceae bacterium]
MSSVVPLVLIAPLMVAVAYCDMRFMRIPNAISLLMVAVFGLCSLVLPMPDLAPRLTAAALVFAVGFVAFCFRLFGGGDVKVLAALVLFVPSENLAQFSYIFSVSMILGVAAILTMRRLPFAGGESWKALSGSTKFPMGISIALAGLLLPLSLLIMPAG